jgi:hypothetical protein
VPSLNGYTALLCRMAADPSRLHRTPAQAAEMGLDPADLARLLGNTDSARHISTDRIARQPQQHLAWVQLGLALRKSSTTAAASPGDAPAARALTHRPEVVRAVHAHAATLTDVSPDPTALAAWIGTMDNTTDLPWLPPMYAF